RRRRRGWGLSLFGDFVRCKLPNEFGECFRDFPRVRFRFFWFSPSRPRQNIVGHPVLRELPPHVRHIGGKMNVATVLAAINVRTCATVVLAPRPSLQPIFSRVARNGTAVGKSQRLLK